MIKEENIKTIFGLKLKQLRQKSSLSLAELSKISGLSASYLNEIEKGKKYPKKAKILSLAEALNSSYDEMVSLKLTDKLAPLSELLTTNILSELPFDLYGLNLQRVVEWMSVSPAKVAAFIGTIVDIAKRYNVHKENFYFASLRTYQELHDNYFPALEEEAKDCREALGITNKEDITLDLLENLLRDKYNYTIGNFDTNTFPDLKSIRSIFKPDNKQLLLNPKLSDKQKFFVYGKELGFNILKIDERPQITVLVQADSFEHILNNFKAAYFACAFLMPWNEVAKDLESFISANNWNGDQLMNIMNRYSVSPELFAFRLTNIVPQHYGLKQLFFLRFQHEGQQDIYKLTKEIHLSRSHNPRANEVFQHYCRRWLSIGSLKKLSRLQESGKVGGLVDIQRSKFYGTKNEYLVFSFSREMNTISKLNSSISIGFALTNTFKKMVKFWNDPIIPVKEVNITCETCEMKNCEERVASPHIIEEILQKKKIKAAIQEIISD